MHPMDHTTPFTNDPSILTSGSLLCDDLHRLGYRRMLMDPSARTSYNIPTAWVLHSGACLTPLTSPLVALCNAVWDAD